MTRVIASKEVSISRAEWWRTIVRTLGPLCLLLVAGVVVYANSLQGVFLFDDKAHIVDNPAIRQLWPVGPLISAAPQRPLLVISLAVNYAFGGLDVRGYHVFNLAVHLAAGLTLYGLVRRTLRLPGCADRYGCSADALAGAAALLWIVHPLNTEAVSYVVQRCESMMALFFLLTMYSCLRAATASRSWPWYCLAFMAYCLSLASKEVAVMVVPVLALYDRLFLAGSWREVLHQRGLVYLFFLGPLALAATWCVPAMFSRNSTAGFYVPSVTPWQYARSQSGVILHYLHLSVWPYPQCLDYRWPVETRWLAGIVVPSLAVGALLGASLWAICRGWRSGFLGGAFFLILAPTSSFMPIQDLCCEHRMYLPLACVVVAGVLGFPACVGWGLRLWSDALRPVSRTTHVPVQRKPGGVEPFPLWSRGLRIGMLVGVAAALAATTHVRNRVYQSEVTAWTEILARRPDHFRGHVSLALALESIGQHARALEHFRIAAQLNAAVAGLLTEGRSAADLHCQRGLACLQQRQTAKAVQEFREALRLEPTHVSAHLSLGKLSVTSQPDVALEHFRTAVQHAPESAEAHNNLGTLLLRTDAEAARPHLERALELNPNYADAHSNIGNLLTQDRRYAEAISHYRQALRLSPGHPAASKNLSHALSLQQRE